MFYGVFNQGLQQKRRHEQAADSISR
jgi:hypothetical protein